MDTSSAADLPEAIDLERTADWRIRKIGGNPSDKESETAAKLLQKLADELRARSSSPAYREYQAICGWLDEFDGMAEFAEYAQDYRARIGVDKFPADGEEYLRVLIGFAKDTFGAPDQPDTATLTERSALSGDRRIVQFRSDGLNLSPVEYARLLAEIAETRRIGVDDYSRGGAVAELEAKMAALLGKEAAVFLPTGTLANHLAIRLLARIGKRVLVQQESHLWNDEGDCAQQLSSLTLVPLAAGRATFTLAEVERAIAGAPEMRVAVPVGAISIETPVRRVAGEAFDREEMRAISAYARNRGIGLHLDGARLLLEAAYTRVDPAETAALFDTVYVSLWKYLNAASGAILAGPRDLLDGLYHQRRMFGGSLPHAWPYAAVALHCLDGFQERFAHAVAAAETFFAMLSRHERVTIERPPAATNVTIVRVTGQAAATLGDRLTARGVLIRPPRQLFPGGAEFALHTNETILHRPLAEIVAAFGAALDA